MSSMHFSIKDNTGIGAMSAYSTESVIVKDWSVVSTDSEGNKTVYVKLLVNEITDLPARDAYTGYILSVGSLAVIASRGLTYRLDSEGRWRNQRNGGVPADVETDEE